MNDLESKQLQLRTSPLLLLLPPTPPTPNFISLRLQPFNFACLLRTTWNQISWRRLGVRLNFSIHLRIIDIGDSFVFFLFYLFLFLFCSLFEWLIQLVFHWISLDCIEFDSTPFDSGSFIVVEMFWNSLLDLDTCSTKKCFDSWMSF